VRSGTYAAKVCPYGLRLKGFDSHGILRMESIPWTGIYVKKTGLPERKPVL